MAESRPAHEVSPDGPRSLAAGASQEGSHPGFSPEGDDIIANLHENPEQGIAGDAARVGPSMTPANTCLPSERPTTGGDAEDDAGSSVSAVTAVGTGAGADPGLRAQTRAQEIADEVSRFCAESSNRISVQARNLIISWVLELVTLCSNMRADAAAERRVTQVLQGQLVDARREIAGLQRRALAAEHRPPVGDVVGGGPVPVAMGLAVRGGPGPVAEAAGSSAAAGSGAARGPTYAAVLSSGVQAGPPGSGLNGPVAAAGQRGPAPPEAHDHVAFLTPTARTESPARDVMRLIKTNIDPVAEEIRDVTLRGTRYGVTVFSNTRQSILNMQRAIEGNNVTRSAVSMRVPERRRPHVKFSGVDPDVATEDFLRELNERNPSLGLDLDVCRVRVSLRERAGTRCHVAEVDPAAFRRIMTCPRLSLGWTVVRAAEDLHVPLCTFCANYGHGRSTCPNAAEPSRAVCTRCGAEGHVGVNCTVRVGSEAESCAPCRRAGLEAAGHAAGSEACPLLREKVARMRNRTDYGPT